MRDKVTTIAYFNNMGVIKSETGNNIHCTKYEVFH